jgi:hypothetical protein
MHNKRAAHSTANAQGVDLKTVGKRNLEYVFAFVNDLIRCLISRCIIPEKEKKSAKTQNPYWVASGPG